MALPDRVFDIGDDGIPRDGRIFNEGDYRVSEGPFKRGDDLVWAPRLQNVHPAAGFQLAAPSQSLEVVYRDVELEGSVEFVLDFLAPFSPPIPLSWPVKVFQERSEGELHEFLPKVHLPGEVTELQPDAIENNLRLCVTKCLFRNVSHTTDG